MPQPLFSKPCDLSLSGPSLQEPGPLRKLKCAAASSWQDQTLSTPVPSKQGWQTPRNLQPSASEKVPREAPALHPDGPPALKSAGQWHSSEGQPDASQSEAGSWHSQASRSNGRVNTDPAMPFLATHSTGTSKVLERHRDASTLRPSLGWREKKTLSLLPPASLPREICPVKIRLNQGKIHLPGQITITGASWLQVLPECVTNQETLP